MGPSMQIISLDTIINNDNFLIESIKTEINKEKGEINE